MSKQPAFQFYPADWLKDTSLQMCSFATQGIWMHILCRMWEQEERGKITGTPEEFCRLIGCCNAEFVNFLQEIRQKFVADVTECNGNVTLINRRMYREQKARNQAKKRVSEYRKRKVEQVERSCNANVTHTSSSSSSTSVKKNNNISELKKENVTHNKTANYSPNFIGCELDICEWLCNEWNVFAKHKVKDADRLGVAMKINDCLQRLHLTLDGLKETLRNYREAVTAPNTKAKHWSIGRWLLHGCDNYTPDNYARDNYVWSEQDNRQPKLIDI